MQIGERISEIIARLKLDVKRNPGNVVALAITVFFMSLYSLFSVIQYYSLGDSAYDLGMHAQMLESFLHGGLFYSPLIGESLLVEHFTIFEFFQVPVYALYPSPISLLIFQDVFVAAAGYVLYRIAKHFLSEHLKSTLAIEALPISFLISYELSPYTQSLVSFPFHSMAFLPFFFLLAMYSFLKEKRLLHFFSLTMIITLHSNFVYIVGIVLLYELIFLRTSRGRDINVWLSDRHDPRGRRQFLYLIIFAFSLYGYLIFSGLMKGYLSGHGVLSLVPTTGASSAASDSPLGIFALMFTDPHSFLSYLSANGNEKAFYTSFILGGTAFLSLLSPLSLIMTVPYFLYAIPSSYASYYQLGYQYGSMLTGPVYFASVIGVYNLILLIRYVKRKTLTKVKRRLWDSSKVIHNVLWKQAGGRSYIALLSVLIIVLSIAMIPFGIFSPEGVFHTPEGSQMQNINYYSLSNASSFLIKESADIPSDAYILTENSLMPYFSNHINTYSTPWSPGIYGNLSKFTYIVLQYNSFWATTTMSVPSLQTIAMTGLANGTYGIIAELPGAGIIVMERK